MTTILPSPLAELRQFCCRDGKRPITRKPTTGNLTTAWTDPDSWMSLGEALAAVERGEKYRQENKENPGEWREIRVSGIGFINAKASSTEEQIIGGDLDACRDPISGELSGFARQFLEDTRPFYYEVSPSGCGIRMFYVGHLPNRVDSIRARGPDDLPGLMKEHVLEAKPEMQEKMAAGKAQWNGIELYEAGRHLTLTGQDPHTSEPVDRSVDIMMALAPLTTTARLQPAMVGWQTSMEKDAAGQRLPEISILAAIDTTGWEETGGQLSGPHPTMGSTTGRNVVVNPAENKYCWMHNGINAGGDSWVWLAHECGAVPWEVPGEGLLRDPAVRQKTLDHALARGLIRAEDMPARIEPAQMLRLEDVAICELKSNGDEKWKFSPTTASKGILSVMKLAMTKSCDKIFYYNGDIYIPDGERVVNNILVEAGGDLATIKNKKEVVSRLHDTLLNFPVEFDPDPYLLGVENGIVDLRSGKFRAYRPEDLMTDKINVRYDETATCPLFVQFIKDIAPNETDQGMLVDWFAIHAIKLMFPYVMFLNGLGRNGKGIYERVLKRFYGDESFSSMALEELDVKNNRFAGVGLYKKRGQIVSEAGDERGKGKRSISTNYLKNATGDGIIDTDQKNMGRLQFKPYYKATIDSNDMPIIHDTSKGWMERFCKADLPYQYVDNPEPDKHPMERKKDPKLFDKLTTKEELSGILNLIIECTKRISETMTITRRSGEEMFDEYRKQSNSVLTFLEMFCDFQEMGGGENVFLDIVYEAYSKWCDLVVCDKVSDKRFGAAVKYFCDGRKPERVNVVDEEGKIKTKRIYRGFSFDANRYQCHYSHTYAIRMPLKEVSVPLVPLSTGNTGVGEEKNKENKCIGSKFPVFSANDTDIDGKNGIGADVGFNGIKSAENENIDIDIDLVEVTFCTEYKTDIGGQMKKFLEGDKITVARSRAEAWQKRGVVRI